MGSSGRIRLFATIIAASLAIAVVCTLFAVYESLERELNRWLPSSNEGVFQIVLLPGGLKQGIERISQNRIDGLELFSAPFVEMEDNRDENAMVIPKLSMRHVNDMQELSAIRTVAWLRMYKDPYVAEEEWFTIYQAPPEYFKLAGLHLSEGRLPGPEDSRSDVILGSTVRSKLFGDKPAVGVELPPSLLGWNWPLNVAGILESAPPAYQAISESVDNRLYHLYYSGFEDNRVLDESSLSSILSILVQPKLWKEKEAFEQVNNYLQQEFGDRVDVQSGNIRGTGYYFGGIATREFFLLRIAWVVVLAAGIAVLNISGAINILLLQERYKLGVLRSVGAPRAVLMGEYAGRGVIIGGVCGLIGFGLSLPISILLGDALQFCPQGCELVEILPGWKTLAIGVGLGVGLWGIGGVFPLRTFLRQSPSALLSIYGTSPFRDWNGKLRGGLAFAISIVALLVILSMRDGMTAQIDRILRWSGGERGGAFVGWTTENTLPGGKPQSLQRAHVRLLRETFPDVPVGWLASKGASPEIEILDASANLSILRPPELLAGRWFTQEEEDRKAYIAVLGYELAIQLAEQRSATINELIGQEWNTYMIVGVMDNWPALYSMGYYSDVAYVPIEAILPTAEEYPLAGQIPFHIPEGRDFEATIEQMRQAIVRHRNAWSDDLESKPQVILPIKQLADLMIWRRRFHMVLGVFAGFSFLVGSVGVMNFVFVWIVSRWHEIGIRRAIGASRGTIFRLVIRQAITLNLKSGVFGGLAGTLAGILVQRSNAWPVVVYPYWIAVAIVAGLLATLIFGGFPALWASFRSPIESLRKE